MTGHGKAAGIWARAASLAAALMLGSTIARAQVLNPPFAARPTSAISKPYECTGLIAPVVRFAPPSKYGAATPGQRQAARDTEDAEAEEAFAEAMAPIKALAAAVIKAANAYRRDGNPNAASCALGHLAHWAKADALSQPETHTGYFKLATTLSGLALGWLQIAPGLDLPARERQLVTAWLGRRGQQVASYFETLQMPRAQRNNHRAWAGLAVAAAATAAQDRALFARGLESFRIVACQATADGALPLELERGRKATEYHLYALSALVMLAEFSARNGQQGYETCQGALHRIFRYSFDALDQPARIAQAAGSAQDAAATIARPSRIAFLEPYLARFPQEAGLASRWLSQRPLGLTDLGGNLTLIYGPPRR